MRHDEALTEKIARATGLRQVWTSSTVANSLTPQRLACVLRDAEIGQHHQQLELAEAMEERDAHYGSVLRTRRLAVQGLEVTVESYSDDARDIEMADLVRDIVRRPEFDELLDDLTDALGKGYVAVVMDWQMGQQWRPTYRWCDPRWFVWDQATGRELRLIDEADPANGVPLAPRRWIVHVPRIKSGLPSRSGLARLAAVAYMCKSWTLKDWMSFADTYGMPLRVGKYGPGASKEDIATLVSAVANIASDAGAVIPESMKIEFVQATAGLSGGNVMFKVLAEYLDAQVTKAVLGHTGSSDSTPGKLGGEDQARKVRRDILTTDAKQLAATLNRDLVRPLIDLNFGVQENYPKLRLPVLKPDDMKLLVGTLASLVPLGLEVEQSVIRSKLRLPDPKRDARGNTIGKLLKATMATADAEPDSGSTEKRPTVGTRTGISADRVAKNAMLSLRAAVDNSIQQGRPIDDICALCRAYEAWLDDRQFAAIMGEAMAKFDHTGWEEIASVGGGKEVDREAGAEMVSVAIGVHAFPI